MSSFLKGQRVRHIKRTDWGVGQLLENENGEWIKVFFDNAGEKSIGAAYRDQLSTVTGTEAHSALLDNMYLPNGEVVARPMVTFAQAKERFLEKFPGGFYGERLQQHERTYKESLLQRWTELLGREATQELLRAEDYGQICDRAARFIRHQDLFFPSPFEKMAFANGMKVLADQRAFASALCDWMNPELPVERRLDPFAQVLTGMDCDKWPILTSFAFFSSPTTEVMIKPVNLQYAAELCRFEINYRPALNSLTYESVVRFYRYLWDKLVDLKPRDMIDVQSFIWCIDPSTYGE